MCLHKQIGIPWSDLPKELLQKIARCLDNEIDALRFRAVCCSWRSSATPFKKFSCETVKLPFPFDPSEPLRGAYFSLVERIVYRVELPGGEEENLNFWLVKTEQSSDGKKRRILNPLSHCPVEIPREIPKVLDTLNFRVSEVCKSYSLKCVGTPSLNRNHGCGYAEKVILCVGEENDEYCVVAIDNDNKLWYTKSGDGKWNGVGDYPELFRFHDLVCCKGQFYGIDLCGSTWVFDLNFEFSKVTHNRHNHAFKKYFVELYESELYLVEVVDKPCPNGPPNEPQLVASWKHEAGIIIYAWSKHEKEWVKTNLVNDCIIVACDDGSYAVPVSTNKTCVFFQWWRLCIDGKDMDPDYAQCLGAFGYICECFCSDLCVSYGDANFVASDEVKLKFRGFHGDKVGVCDYQSGKTGSVLKFPEYAGIFWPPPPWLYHT